MSVETQLAVDKCMYVVYIGRRKAIGGTWYNKEFAIAQCLSCCLDRKLLIEVKMAI